MDFDNKNDLARFIQDPKPAELRAFRKKRHNLTVKALAEEIGGGVSEARVANWEFEGRGRPKGPALDRLRLVIRKLEGDARIPLHMDSELADRLRHQAKGQGKSVEQFILDVMKAVVGIFLLWLFLNSQSPESDPPETNSFDVNHPRNSHRESGRQW